MITIVVQHCSDVYQYLLVCCSFMIRLAYVSRYQYNDRIMIMDDSEIISMQSPESTPTCIPEKLKSLFDLSFLRFLSLATKQHHRQLHLAGNKQTSKSLKPKWCSNLKKRCG